MHMNYKQQLNLIELSTLLIESQTEQYGIININERKMLKFNMNLYADNMFLRSVHSPRQALCGTSCCAAGFWGLVKYPEANILFDNIIEKDFGVGLNRNYHLFSFLFGARWSSALDYDARGVRGFGERALYYLQWQHDNSLPPLDDFKMKGLHNHQIIEELQLMKIVVDEYFKHNH